MKVVMQSATTITASSTTENVLTGQRYERCPFNAFGALYCAGSAAGLTAELNVGGNSVSPPTTVNAQNRLPVVPDDLLVDGWEAPEGRLIQVRAVNTTGGNLVLNWRVELDEVTFQE